MKIYIFTKRHLCCELGVGTGPQLGEPGVVLQGGDDADQISLVQMLEVGQAELVRVVREVDRVHVPGNLSHSSARPGRYRS